MSEAHRLRLPIDRTWDGEPARADEIACVEITQVAAGLSVHVDAPYHRDPLPTTPSGPTAGLWEFEVVELFIAGPAERYLEVELGPHGHYLVLRLDGVRRPFAQQLPMDYAATSIGSRWTGEALVPWAWLPEGPHRVNAYAIHGAGPARRYLAHAPTGGPQPDFHQLQGFVPVGSLAR